MLSAQKLCGAAAIVALTGASASACVMMPQEPPAFFWCEDHGDTDMDGLNNFWIGMEITLFGATDPTNCACGLGITGPTAPLLEIDGVSVTITNLDTKESQIIPEFTTLTPNANTAAGLTNIDPTNTWFGFSGLVQPTYPTTPPPGNVFKIWFDVDAPDLASLQGAFGTVAGGEGDANGFPFPTGPHAIQLFAPINNTLWVVPAPGALSCFAGAGLCVIRRRR
ncbi:MAG: hypothetical protein Tsb0013_18390 [Phycisphaerales bacterium]